jgi:hypothetical protein
MAKVTGRAPDRARASADRAQGDLPRRSCAGSKAWIAAKTGFDEARHVRVMRRCTINGDRPF